MKVLLIPLCILAVILLFFQCKPKPGTVTHEPAVRDQGSSATFKQVFSTVDKNYPKLSDATGMHVSAIGGTSSSDIIVVGDKGFVMVYDTEVAPAAEKAACYLRYQNWK